MVSIIKEFQQAKTFLGFSLLKLGSNCFIFLIPLILAKFFSPEQFGSYSLSMMIVYFFASLLLRPFGNPFVVFSNEEQKETQKISKTLTARLFFLSISFVLFIISIFVFRGYIAQFASITNIQVLFLFFVFTGLGIRQMFGSLFLALYQRLMNGIYDLLVGISMLFFLFGLYYFNLFSLEYIFLIFLLAPLVVTIFILPFIKRKSLFPLSFDVSSLKKMFDYSKWIILGGTAVYFIHWGDNLVLRMFVSFEEIGIYNFGYQVFKATIIISTFIPMYFLPFITRFIDDPEKISAYLFKKRIKILLFGSLCFILFFIFFPFLLNLIYGSTYQDSYNVTRILLIGSFFGLYRMFYHPLFNAMKKYKFIQLSQVCSFIINFSLNFIFVPLFGILGAAIATTITYISMAFFHELYFWKICKKKLRI